MKRPKNFGENIHRTEEYLKNFSREKTLKYLIKDENPIIFDIGANNGSSLIEFIEWWSASEIHCFEPQSECWAELEQTAKHAKNCKVEIKKFAVGSSNDPSADFYSHDLNTGISGLYKLNIDSKDSVLLNELRPNKERITNYAKTINHHRKVTVRRLDDYIQQDTSLNKINLMKLDIQGHEVEALKGMGDMLGIVEVIITELNFYDLYLKYLSFSELESCLAPYGFKFYDISHISKNPLNGRTDWVDIIYINTNLIKL
jgi:FkbM family methyltransferase